MGYWMGAWFLPPLAGGNTAYQGHCLLDRSLYHLLLDIDFLFPTPLERLTSYKLLILHTYRQFSRCVWLDYDQAVRQHAAAVKLVDWSALNGQLFNFHTAGASL